MRERLLAWLLGPRCVWCSQRHGGGRHAWLEYACCAFAHSELAQTKRTRFMEE